MGPLQHIVGIQIARPFAKLCMLSRWTSPRPVALPSTPCSAMLSLVLLFTIFLGLVGILALYGEWKRKRLSPSPKPPGDGGEVVAWMEREGCCVPTVDQFVAVFNQVATTRKVQPDDGVSLREGSLVPSLRLYSFYLRGGYSGLRPEAIFLLATGRVLWSPV